MEILVVPVWMVLLVAFLTAVVVYLGYMSMTFNTFEVMGVEGPSPTAVLGHLGYVLFYGRVQTQALFYQRYRMSKVYGIFEGRQPCLIMRDIDFVNEVLTNHSNKLGNRPKYFGNHSVFYHMLRNLPQGKWVKTHQIVSTILSESNLKNLVRSTESSTAALTKFLKQNIEEEEEVELRSMASQFARDALAGSGLGLYLNSFEEPYHEFYDNARKVKQDTFLNRMLAIFCPFLLQYTSKIGLGKISQRAVDFFTKLVTSISNGEQGDSSVRSDFVYQISQTTSSYKRKYNMDPLGEGVEQSFEGLTDLEAAAQAISFYVGGLDTITSVISFALFLLTNHPDCRKRAQREIDENLRDILPNYENVQRLHYLDICIQETLRMFPPIFNIDKVCMQDFSVDGINIPKGMVLRVPVYSIQHDEQYWPTPDSFKPERFVPELSAVRNPCTFLPFGHGPRVCPGMHLAIAQSKMALAAILQQLNPVSCDLSVHPVNLSRFSLTASDNLWVNFEKRY